MNSLARTLRRQSTDAERILWSHLRHRQLAGYKFRRQHEIGTYVVDFLCLEAMLIIEVDGGQHLERVHEDNIRTKYLESLGYRILRFWNNEILSDTEAVLESINRRLDDPSPQPSP